jgi:hypothetical protein
MGHNPLFKDALQEKVLKSFIDHKCIDRTFEILCQQSFKNFNELQMK